MFGVKKLDIYIIRQFLALLMVTFFITLFVIVMQFVWLRIDDMLGKNKSFSPKFLRRYADLHTIMTDAIGRFVTDVKTADFPSESEQY